MIDNTLTVLLSFQFTNYVGLFLYWVPLSLCIFVYTIRTWQNYQKDLVKRTEAEKARGNGYYSPTDTVGALIGRALVSVLPVANLWAALFDVAPILFRHLFRFIGKVFDQPLVPKRKL